MIAADPTTGYGTRPDVGKETLLPGMLGSLSSKACHRPGQATALFGGEMALVVG